MLRKVMITAVAILNSACSSFPGEGRGGMAEFEPLRLAFWDTQDKAILPTDGLKFEITLLKHQLDLLVLEGAKICFPASVAQAKLTEQRMMREYNGGLLLDAANQVEIQQHALLILEKRLDVVVASGACQLEKAVSPEPAEVADSFDLQRLLNGLNRNNQFAFDSAKLTPAYQDQLIQLLPELKRIPHHIEITGHTDPKGSEPYNQSLSQQRAQSVAAFLTEQGIPKLRIYLYAAGKNRPYAKGDTQEHYHSSRRVTLALRLPNYSPQSSTQP